MRTRVTLDIWGKRLTAATAVAAALVGASCSPDPATASKANVYLVVTEVSTTDGAKGKESAFLLSDVDPVFNDDATLKLTNTSKNPLLPSSSPYNDVALERYTVRYYRSDGRNAEGVDVPYSFQGPLGGTVANGSGTTDVAFILVRHQAKIEPPLMNLAGQGGAKLISAFADVTIFGRTLSGEVVSAQATIAITFADFADD
jgi:hypothetical protein